VELTGERLEFSSPDTIVSPRKPQRTVDREIAILDKALQGVPWKERDKTLDLLEWDWQEEVGQTPEPQMEARRAGYGECSTPEATEERGNRGAEETRETIEGGTGNPVEMGVSEAEQEEEVEEEGNNEMEGEISEDEVPPV
jgi:hypothetical protein